MSTESQSIVTSGLEPYTPGSAKPWNKQRLLHLLRRTRIGLPTKQEIEQKLTMTPQQVIDQIMTVSPNVNPPSWVNDPDVQMTDENKEIIKGHDEELTNWWMNLCYSDNSIREKMVYFWANHFVVEKNKVKAAQYIYKIYQSFRNYALGDFRELTRTITKDPAMLIYLDGNKSKKGAINENYARELQELFTIGRGNYSQQDVSEAGKALSGWTINRNTLSSVFVPKRFDDSIKTFYGRTGNFDADDIVDIIFEQEQTSKFIAGKLYTFFVYREPDENIINQLASIIRQDNYKIERAVKTLLSSEHFFDSNFIGADIKAPFDLTLGILRQFNATADAVSLTAKSLNSMGQSIFNPPDVAGWDSHRSWINATYLSNRNAYVNALFTSKYFTYLNINAFISAYPTDSATNFIKAVLDDLLAAPVTDEIINALSKELAKNQTTFNPTSSAGQKSLTDVLKIIFKMPEFHLS